MKQYKHLIIIAVLIGLIVVGVVSLRQVLSVRAQSELTKDLEQRLTQEGVQVKEIKILSHSPFQIEIQLLSSSTGNKKAPEDFWYKHLTWREAALSYKRGYPLDGFTLVIVNSLGEQIDWSQHFLNPDDPSQKIYPFGSPEPDDQLAEKLVVENIDLQDFILETIDVTSGIGSDNSVQLLKIHLVSPSKEIANNILPSFIPSLRPSLTKINKEPGARIAIIWLEVVEDTGELLLEYLWDLEIERQTWHMAEGITGGWFSTPLEPEPSEEPTTLPMPETTQSPTPTDRAYP